MDQLLDLLRHRPHAMTESMTCPECEGARGHRIGRLFLACPFCAGRGTVGGAHEPVDRLPPPSAPLSVAEHRVWRDPAVAGYRSCRYCLGVGHLAHVDETTRTLSAAPCPCTRIPRI
jgi:RecJ-like exonuclease